MPKCDFNKDANLSESHFGVSVLLYIFAEYLWGAASEWSTPNLLNLLNSDL